MEQEIKEGNLSEEAEDTYACKTAYSKTMYRIVNGDFDLAKGRLACKRDLDCYVSEKGGIKVINPFYEGDLGYPTLTIMSNDQKQQNNILYQFIMNYGSDLQLQLIYYVNMQKIKEQEFNTFDLFDGRAKVW